MTEMPRLERDLTVWFAESANPRVPDYTDDILRRTAASRQRPRWTFPTRWLPARIVASGRVGRSPVAWRTVALLAIFALLLAGTAALIGALQRPTLPAPFGLAANGLVAYGRAGDIFTVDPVTGARRTITSGPGQDVAPRFSLDGTRMAIIREGDTESQLIVVGIDGSGMVVSDAALRDVDADSLTFSPDGQWASVVASERDGRRSIFLMDVDDGHLRRLRVDPQVEVFWRPPDGREILFLRWGPLVQRLSLVSVSDGTVRDIPLPPGPTTELRPLGWTPDGRSVVYQGWSTEDEDWRTIVLDIETGDVVVLDVWFGHISNDGRRVVGLRPEEDGSPQTLCVTDVTGRRCTPIGRGYGLPSGEFGRAIEWSPDDEWLVVHPGTGPEVVLIDPEGTTRDQPPWIADGAMSWQRKAP